jgi:ubiquinone/menaquinone biosynthesis C-methylase UbiE
MVEDSHVRALPSFSLAGLTILDIGCADGYAFDYPEFRGAAAMHGIDVDAAAIAAGQAKNRPNVRLQVAAAEELPYEDGKFDVVISRVALPYTNIPVALHEIRRVLKPGGRVFLSIHDVRLQWEFLSGALSERAWKRILDHAYIGAASLALNTVGYCPARPWNGTRETVQTVGGMTRLLRAARFGSISAVRVGRHRLVEAIAQ